jgi:glycosidase
MNKLLIALFVAATLPGVAQVPDIQKVEPPFWWTQMKHQQLQLLVYGKNIGGASVSLQYPGVTLDGIVKTENPNYLFINLTLDGTTQPGNIPITFTQGKKSKVVSYAVQARKPGSAQRKGFNPSDVIYLIMPDRFANGDESNDNVAGMLQTVSRQEPFGRHGGDLKGISNHLDYLQQLGVTALWLNPVQENNQPKESYHGYAITDFYKIDPRFGTNDQYVQLANDAHQRGIKMIMDMVFNHCGSEHWFFKDLPTHDWVHQFKEFTRSNYRLSTAVDPYVSQYDSDKMLQGWFDHHMPDLNQHNPLLATYLIQNSIWWIEYAGLDGIRMDTHPYPYKDFMSRWAKYVMEEYPNFNIVGEVYAGQVQFESYWQRHATNTDGYQGHLPSVTDFTLSYALNGAFNENDGWDTGLARIYYALVEDLGYTEPFNNVTFLDNHDVSRFATVVNNDPAKVKMGLATLLTTRGIPQIFYGTEILMTGPGNNHGVLRGDFPGGWKGDAASVAGNRGLSPEQQDILNYTRTLLQWRKNTPVVHEGKLMHFIPEDGLYVYFRYTDNESVMVILNNTSETKTLDTKRFAERLTGYREAVHVVSKERITNLQQLTVAPKSATILELQK